MPIGGRSAHPLPACFSKFLLLAFLTRLAPARPVSSLGTYTQESNFTELEKAFAEARRRSVAQGVKPPPAQKKPAEAPAAAEKQPAAEGKAVASKAAKPKTAPASKVKWTRALGKRATL